MKAAPLTPEEREVPQPRGSQARTQARARPIETASQQLADIERRQAEATYVARLKSMPYKEYLASSHWRAKRAEALKRARFRCSVCNGNGILDVHHRTYIRRGEESPADLTVLCRTCHDTFHKQGKLT